MSHSLHARRRFLRGTGVALALPFLELTQGTAKGNTRELPRRLVCICTGLGIHRENLYPTKAGRDWELTPYPEPFKDIRDQVSLFSGLSHPDVDGGHSSEGCFLTAAVHPGGTSFKNSISLDQYAHEQLAPDTRIPSLQLTTSDGTSISFSRHGTSMPGEGKPSVVFKKLFVTGTPKEIQQQVDRLKDGRSVMDSVLEEANSLNRKLGPQDKQRLDEYLSSVREVELRLQKAQEWSSKPKPKVEVDPPKDIADATDIIGRSNLLYDLMHLAIQTDSTRIFSVSLFGHNAVPPIKGISIDWHSLSHHGNDPGKLSQLKIIELEQFKSLGMFLSKLHKTREAGESLLDRSMVVYGSNLGNANSHDTKNLPILFAGGGFHHGSYHAFDSDKNTPLCNLYLSMLHRLGLEQKAFGSSRSTLTSLRMT